MSKYIDVESLIDSLEKCQYDIEDSIYGKGFGKATETMLGILRAYPTANVAPIADTVREIFDLVECAFSPVLVYEGQTIKRYIAELKKKYTEGGE